MNDTPGASGAVRGLCRQDLVSLVRFLTMNSPTSADRDRLLQCVTELLR
jgi:hypothetical protein